MSRYARPFPHWRPFAVVSAIQPFAYTLQACPDGKFYNPYLEGCSDSCDVMRAQYVPMASTAAVGSTAAASLTTTALTTATTTIPTATGVDDPIASVATAAEIPILANCSQTAPLNCHRLADGFYPYATPCQHFTVCYNNTGHLGVRSTAKHTLTTLDVIE